MSPSALQLLDLPGIIEGAKDGKGRGRQVIAGRENKLYCTQVHTHRPLFVHIQLIALDVGFSGSYMQPYPDRSGRSEASRTQEADRARAGGLRDPPEQATSQHRLQEEGQRRHQLHHYCTSHLSYTHSLLLNRLLGYSPLY